MTVPTVSCTNCGKNFTTDDLRGTSCRYCGTLLAHHARAAQQVAVINHMMADRNGNGIPDAYEGLVANAQANAMNQAFGGYPYGASPPGQPNAMHPMHAQHMHAMNAGVAEAGRTMGKIAMFIVIPIVLVVFLSVGIGFATFFLAH
jgi:hypothetical protein